MNIHTENSSLINIRDLYNAKKRALKGSTLDAIFIAIASHIAQLSASEKIWVFVVESYPVHVRTLSVSSNEIKKNTIIPMENVNNDTLQYISSKLKEQGMRPIGPGLSIYKF